MTISLPKPTSGEPHRFEIYNSAEDLYSLVDPTQYAWSLIKHLCVRDVAESLLYNTYAIKKANDVKEAAKNIAIYIDQASEFYEAGLGAKTNTAPLLYYYCFLNLAKARCEMFWPRFHKRAENYHHGLTWNANHRHLVNIETETVRATTRGVWHALYEAVVSKPCLIANPSTIRIIDLFSICSEICEELELTTRHTAKFISLEKPCIMVNPSHRKAWIRFSFDRDEVRSCRLSRKSVLRLLTSNINDYRQVQSEESSQWTFELKNKKTIRQGGVPFDAVKDEIRAMNLFTFPVKDEIEYMVSIQNRLPVMMPQLMTLYTLMFWLGSLVRYDPASVHDLQDSREWLLLDAFQTQSRLWLLSLFLWEFYQTKIIIEKSL